MGLASSAAVTVATHAALDRMQGVALEPIDMRWSFDRLPAWLLRPLLMSFLTTALAPYSPGVPLSVPTSNKAMNFTAPWGQPQ